MKSIIKTTLYILFILLAFNNVKVKAQEVQPDAIYLDQLKEYTLNPDGSWSYHYSHKLKLLTYYSIHTLYGEDFILYNPDFQKLKINHSITTMADGTVVPAPENACNELLPGFAANAPAFNQLREMAVTHTGLERGCVEDFDYILSSAKGFTPMLTGNEALWMNSPVDKLTFMVHVPSNVTFNYSQYNLREKPRVTKAGNQVTYSWTLNNLPAATREDYRPRELQNRPRIVFSTSRNAGKLLQSFVSQAAFEFKSDERIQTLASEVRKEMKNDMAVMMRLQDVVANEINYNPVPLALTGYRVRNSTETFKANGGSEPEKAVLLATMLKLSGLNAFPVAIVPERYFDKKSFNLQLVEKFLVKVTDSKGETFYISPIQTDLQDQEFQLSGKTIISLIPGKSLQIENEKVPAGELDATGNFELSKEMDLKGKTTLSLSNRLNPFLKLSQDSTYVRKILIGLMESAKIDTFSFDRIDKEHTTIQYQLSSTDFAKERAGHYFLKIPTFSAGIEGWHMTELVSTRIEPLEIPFLVNESYRYTITLPEGYELITAESSLSLKKEFGSLSIHISQEGRTLEIDKKISLVKTIIEPTEYSEFKSFLNTWNNKKYRELIIRIGPK